MAQRLVSLGRSNRPTSRFRPPSPLRSWYMPPCLSTPSQPGVSFARNSGPVSVCRGPAAHNHGTSAPGFARQLRQVEQAARRNRCRRTLIRVRRRRSSQSLGNSCGGVCWIWVAGAWLRRLQEAHIPGKTDKPYQNRTARQVQLRAQAESPRANPGACSGAGTRPSQSKMPSSPCCRPLAPACAVPSGNARQCARKSRSLVCCAA